MDLSNLMGGNKPQATEPSTDPVAMTPDPVTPVVEPTISAPAPVDPVMPPAPAAPAADPMMPTAMPEPVAPAVPEPMAAPAPVDPVMPPAPVAPAAFPPAEPVMPPEPINPPQDPVPPTPPEPITTPEPIVAADPTVGAEPAAAAGSTPPQEVFEGVGSGKYKVVVIKDKCIGAASCIAVSPKTFELNDQQIAKVLPTVTTETDENLLLAAQSCPTLAIEVYDTVSGEKVWPK